MSAETTRPRQVSLALGDVPSLISPEKVAAISGIRPVFQKWLHSPHAEEVARQYIETGVVRNVDEALALFTSSFPDINLYPKVTLRDHSQGGSRAELRKLRKVQGSEIDVSQERAANTFGQFGSLSHNAVRDLYSNRLPRMSKQVRERLDQLSLFPLARQSVLFDMQAGSPYAEGQQGFPSDTTLAAIESGRDELRTAIQSNDIDLYAYASSMNDQLLPIFGDHVIKLESKRNSSLGKELASITAVNWATAVLNFYRGDPESHQVLFTEVPIKGLDVPAFRLDGLDVLTIAGRAPTREQRVILAGLAQQRFDDPGHIVHDVRKALGEQDVAFGLMEYKFDVGDNNDNRAQLIDEETVTLDPMPAHVAQAQRYLALATASDYYRRSSFDPRSWPRTSPFSQGTLQYWIHTLDGPKEFDISATVAQQKDIFEDFASKSSVVRERAADRAITRFFVTDLSQNILHGVRNGEEGVDSKQNGHKSPPVVPRRSLDALVREHRIFLDANKVLEQVGNNGHTEYRFHFSHLLDAIQNGEIELNRSVMGRSGFIRCLFPDHDDHNPSMHYDLDRMEVYCFSCRRGGAFDLASLPEGFTLSPIAARKAGRTKEAQMVHPEAIPQEHFETMQKVQDIFEQTYDASPHAAAYLEGRGLNPSIAAYLGVGFCDGPAMVTQLLQTGMTIEDLEKYGLIYNSREGRIRTVLDKRITYPLAVRPGMLTNFYGRSIRENEDKKFKHRKLNNKTTNVPQGVFNIDALYSDSNEVIIVEGTHDALSLIQMGYEDVIAIIGTHNTYALQMAAESGKDIAIGLDKGQSERDITAGFFETLDQFGHHGKKRDFTVDFMQQFPDYAISEAKDFNEYLVSTEYCYK